MVFFTPLLLSPEQQKASVPCCVTKTLHQLHAALLFQVFSSMGCHVPTNLKSLEVVEVAAAHFAQPSRSRAVTLPRLSFQQQILAERSQPGEETQKPCIPMIKMNPHSHRKTGAQVEPGASQLLQIRVQHRLALGLIHDIQRDELDVLGKGVEVLCSEN